MSKVLKSWSGMRKYLEKDMLADSLKGKVRYNCTTYVGMDGCFIFEVFLDDKLFKQFSWETVNSYFIKMVYADKPAQMTITDYWKDFWQLVDEYPISERTEYTDEEFSEALKKYRQSDIKDSLYSDNPIVKMFALLDRRVGKRTLDKISDSISSEPEWLQKVYDFRIK
ncbi:hypothetical protein SAMN02910298_00386 [Pseudobutyrivibrio sp. YE44]|uniref:SF0329 family protein n=1 Tax=Pseudobutyrivibrio sp. YE44 TaxID=1520802 RepID=UPI00088BB0D5|nr:hypothetical protein [Pseudobutyrivibrio sp. YE44]SDB09094.1 hypothetical protein SAMN02910298_00386 [Pseudobutyrivibrio sp. YE44]